MRYIITQEHPTTEKDILAGFESLADVRKEERSRRKDGERVEIFMLSPVVPSEETK